jgi:hypothetical protein
MRAVLMAGVVLSFAVLELGCSSSGSDPAGCTVTCPPGTQCEGNRCLPLCSPACGAGEYCGADRVCHQGTAPDGATVPPVDAGAKYDKGGGPAPDAAQKLDAGNSALCACLAQQPKQAYCFKQAVSCSKPADCCGVSSVPCGTYSNKFACVAGKCVRAGCQSKAECVTYAQAIKQPAPGDWACHQPLCPGTLAYCARAIKSCAKPADCCSASSGMTCGIYTNHWGCKAGACEYLGCQAKAECVTYAQISGIPNAGTWTCRTSACVKAGYCTTPVKSCAQPADCCVPGSAIPCGVYGNRYRCEAGECVLDRCTGKQDCTNYATSLKVPDPGAYNCIEY